jgi:hypothetical protein
MSVTEWRTAPWFKRSATILDGSSTGLPNLLSPRRFPPAPIDTTDAKARWCSRPCNPGLEMRDGRASGRVGSWG